MKDISLFIDIFRSFLLVLFGLHNVLRFLLNNIVCFSAEKELEKVKEELANGKNKIRDMNENMVFPTQVDGAVVSVIDIFAICVYLLVVTRYKSF